MNATEIRKKLGYSTNKELFAVLGYSPSSMSQIRSRDILNGTSNYDNILKLIILKHSGIDSIENLIDCVALHDAVRKISKGNT